MYILYFGFLSCLFYWFQIQNTLLVCDVINSSYANFVEEITMLYQRKNWLQVWLTDNKLTKVTLLKQSKLLGPFQQAETYPQAQMHHIGCRFGYPALFITYTKGRSTLWRQVGTYIHVHYSAISVKLTKLWMICKKTDSKVVSKRCFNQFWSKFKSWGLKYDINKSFRRDFGTRFKIPNKTNTIFSGSKGIFFFK